MIGRIIAIVWFVGLAVTGGVCRAENPSASPADASLAEFFIGVTYSARGECEQAIPFFQRALALHRAPAVYRELAECYAYQGSMEAAIHTLDEALKLYPDDGECYAALGGLYYELFRSGMASEEISRNALNNLKKAWELVQDPEAGARAVEVAVALKELGLAVEVYEALPIEVRRHPQLLARMIQVYDERKNASRVLKALRMMVNARVQDPGFLERVANLAISRSYYREALALMEQRIALDPETFQDWDRLMFVALAAENCDTTRRLYDQRFATAPTPLADYSLAICVAREHDYDRAAALFARAIDRGGGFWDEKTRRNLVRDYIRTLVAGNQLDQAMAVIRKEQGREEADPSLDALRFYVLLLQGREPEAKALLAKLAEKDNMQALVQRARAFQGHWDALGRFYRGSVAYATEDYELAQPDLEAALRIRPDALDIVVPLAFIYDRNGDREKVLAIYRKAMETHPDNALLLNNYSYSMLIYGEDPKTAISYARKALAQDPDNPTYRDTLGYALLLTGALDEAEEHLVFAYDRMPQEGEICEHLGDLWFRRGDREKARELWLEAIENGGVDEEAIRRKLAFLDR